MSMSTSLPSTEQAFRDTLLHRAKGTAFSTLARMYHLPRPGVIPEEDWREALRAVVYGCRGTRGNLHEFLEAALAQFNVSFHCSVTPANPQRLTYLSGGTAGGFEARHVNRLFRVTYSRGSFIFKSVSPTFIGGPAVQGLLELCPISTAYWRGASFGEVENVQVELLPFVWSDTGAVFYLWADMESIVPPTYMQTQVRWAASEVPALPGSSAFPQAADSEDSPVWGSPAGPAVVEYVVTEDTAGTWSNLIVNADTDGAPARGDAYTITLRKKVAGVFVDTLLTCSMGAAVKLASDLVNSVVLAAGDVVTLRVTAGAAVTAPLVWPRASVHIARPAGQPMGGQVLESAWIPGDQGAGPWPLYLGESLDMELMTVLWNLLAAGVVLDQKVAAFQYLNGLP